MEGFVGRGGSCSCWGRISSVGGEEAKLCRRDEGRPEYWWNKFSFICAKLYPRGRVMGNL